jgi:hypothetical protein
MELIPHSVYHPHDMPCYSLFHTVFDFDQNLSRPLKLPKASRLEASLEPEKEHITTFTGVEKISYEEDEKSLRIFIPDADKHTEQAMVLKAKDNEISILFENGRTPYSAVALYKHGLNAWQETLKLNGANTKYLPQITFNQRGLIIKMPFRMPRPGYTEQVVMNTSGQVEDYDYDIHGEPTVNVFRKNNYPIMFVETYHGVLAPKYDPTPEVRPVSGALIGYVPKPKIGVADSKMSQNKTAIDLINVGMIHLRQVEHTFQRQ